MHPKPLLRNQTQDYNITNPKKVSKEYFVRVVDIILDENHPEFNKYGRWDCIGVIKYKEINTRTQEEDPQKLPIAFPSNSSIKQYPLVNEIVVIQSQPGAQYSPKDRELHKVKMYWTSIVNFWNHPHHNAYIDQNLNPESEVDLGYNFKTADTTAPLQPIHGDLLLEGRYGQSIRFTGGSYPENPWINEENNSKPLTIIKNGQSSTDNGVQQVYEDVNQDSSSIYLTTEHKVDLVPPNSIDNALSYGYDNVRPAYPSLFTGSQVLINSDRVYLNSRKESTFINSFKNIGLQSNTVNIDANSTISLDAQKIYLGESAFNSQETFKENVVKGATLEIWLQDLVLELKDLAQDLIEIEVDTLPLINARGYSLLENLESLEKELPAIKSKKVYTE